MELAINRRQADSSYLVEGQRVSLVGLSATEVGMAAPGDASGKLHDHLPVDPDLLAERPDSSRPGARHQARAQRSIVLVIACAGALGALARYGLSRLITAPVGHFPWSTFWINVSGSLVIGFVLVLVTERFPRARLARPLIATGFLGAYTTFSTYMVDADLLFRGRELATGIAYVVASLTGGLVAVSAGVVLARWAIRADRRLHEGLG